MSILINRSLRYYYLSCSGEKLEEIKRDDLMYWINTNVKLEEGFTLRDLYNFISQTPSISDNPMEEDYEYISITPKFVLDIRSNGVQLLNKSYTSLMIETMDDSLFIFDYMISNQVLDLEIRIERETIEYSDVKFFMPPEITLAELYSIIQTGIIDTSVE